MRAAPWALLALSLFATAGGSAGLGVVIAIAALVVMGLS